MLHKSNGPAVDQRKTKGEEEAGVEPSCLFGRSCIVSSAGNLFKIIFQASAELVQALSINLRYIHKRVPALIVSLHVTRIMCPMSHHYGAGLFSSVPLHVKRKVIGPGERAMAKMEFERLRTRVLPCVSSELVTP